MKISHNFLTLLPILAALVAAQQQSSLPFENPPQSFNNNAAEPVPQGISLGEVAQYTLGAGAVAGIVGTAIHYGRKDRDAPVTGAHGALPETGMPNSQGKFFDGLPPYDSISQRPFNGDPNSPNAHVMPGGDQHHPMMDDEKLKRLRYWSHDVANSELEDPNKKISNDLLPDDSISQRSFNGDPDSPNVRATPGGNQHHPMMDDEKLNQNNLNRGVANSELGDPDKIEGTKPANSGLNAKPEVEQSRPAVNDQNGLFGKRRYSQADLNVQRTAETSPLQHQSQAGSNVGHNTPANSAADPAAGQNPRAGSNLGQATPSNGGSVVNHATAQVPPSHIGSGASTMSSASGAPPNHRNFASSNARSPLPSSGASEASSRYTDARSSFSESGGQTSIARNRLPATPNGLDAIARGASPELSGHASNPGRAASEGNIGRGSLGPDGLQSRLGNHESNMKSSLSDVHANAKKVGENIHNHALSASNKASSKVTEFLSHLKIPRLGI